MSIAWAVWAICEMAGVVASIVTASYFNTLVGQLAACVVFIAATFIGDRLWKRFATAEELLRRDERRRRNVDHL